MNVDNLIDALSSHRANNLKTSKPSVNNKSVASFKEALYKTLESDNKQVKKNEPKKSTEKYSDLNNSKIVDMKSISSLEQKTNILKKIDKIISDTSNPSEIEELAKEINEICTEFLAGEEDFDSDKEKEMLDALSALLSGFQTQVLPIETTVDINSSGIDLSLETSIIDGSQVLVAVNDTDGSGVAITKLEDLISSIEDKLSKISTFEEVNSSGSNKNDISTVASNMVENIASILSGDKINSNLNHIDSKKEDINLLAANLDISGIVSTNNISENLSIDGTDKLHPIARQVLNNIESKIDLAMFNEKTLEVRLKLFPSRLGSITVSIEHDGYSLKVSLLSDNESVRSLLMDSVNDLRHELNNANKGYVYVDVSSEQSQNNNNKYNNEENNNIENINVDSYLDDVAIKLYSKSTLLDKILDITI